MSIVNEFLKVSIVTESYDVSNVKKEVFELTLVLKMPKIQTKK